MKMKQGEVVKAVIEFARAARYIGAIVTDIKPDEANKRWIVTINSDDGSKTFVVDDDSGNVSFGSVSSVWKAKE